jgi:hypothetical protein
VGFLERDFERDHLAEKNNRTKMGQKIHCAVGAFKKRMNWRSIHDIGLERDFHVMSTYKSSFLQN